MKEVCNNMSKSFAGTGFSQYSWMFYSNLSFIYLTINRYDIEENNALLENRKTQNVCHVWESQCMVKNHWCVHSYCYPPLQDIKAVAIPMHACIMLYYVWSLLISLSQLNHKMYVFLCKCTAILTPPRSCLQTKRKTQQWCKLDCR